MSNLPNGRLRGWLVGWQIGWNWDRDRAWFDAGCSVGYLLCCGSRRQRVCQLFQRVFWWPFVPQIPGVGDVRNCFRDCAEEWWGTFPTHW
jgi:hypothetical protein